jgi:DNA-binding NtrC family response regulator
MSLESVLDRSDQAAPVPHAGTAPYHILVADDQREVLEAIRLLLTGPDCSVAGATSPDGALDLATSETFDAALIDLNYGKGLTSGEQGLDLVSALVGEAPTLPIVVMTAWGSMDLAVEAVRRGARDLVEKPWDEERLAGMLRSHAELGRASGSSSPRCGSSARRRRRPTTSRRSTRCGCTTSRASSSATP